MNKIENRYLVYQHRRPDTGDVFYIGIGTVHRPTVKSTRNAHWKSIVAKNNGDFIVEILHENTSREFAVKTEMALIKKYGRSDNGTGILCNQTDGGDGGAMGVVSKRKGIKCSGETIARIKAARANHPPQSDETKEKRAAKLRGRVMSPEYRARMKVWFANGKKADRRREKHGMWGKHHTKEANDKQRLLKALNIISKIDIATGDVLGEYYGIYEAARSENISGNVVRRFLSGESNNGRGFLWKATPNPFYRSTKKKSA